MRDAQTRIRIKMKTGGVNPAAINAFLHQYSKVVRRETGMIPESEIEAAADLPRIEDQAEPEDARDLADQSVILKLNGGLGTSMGLEKAKSLLAVRGELTFLDIIVRQFLRFRAELSPRLTLLFMNSFSTSDDTRKALAACSELGDPAALELLQNRVPKIAVDTLEPIEWPANPTLEWCPPGHGDLYPALLGSGRLDELLAAGKRYLFVSNSDNLGAALDLRLLAFFAKSEAPFLMEVTRRTAADKKGGHIAVRKSDGCLLLRESAQCLDEDKERFQDINYHRYFNTNNLWIRLDALKAELERNGGLLPLPLIRNTKTVDPRNKQTPKVYQLETAMGAAIECFDHAQAIEVPRSRFAPVKTTADLFAVRSDAYVLDGWFLLALRPERNLQPPIIQVDERYQLVDGLEALGVEPSLVRCQRLQVTGPVRFEQGVVLEGEVEFINRGSELKTVAAGTYRDRKVEL
jgi:UDP-N-acetylglucosamine pyrophosphorylase